MRSASRRRRAFGTSRPMRAEGTTRLRDCVYRRALWRAVLIGWPARLLGGLASGAALTRHGMGVAGRSARADPFSAHLVPFRGRRGDPLKALW